MKKKIKLLTLVLVCQEDNVLLGLKKRGFGVGRWNGFGGKVEAGETIEQAAKRELLEESGIIGQEFIPYGRIEFEFEDTHELLEVHIFRCENFSGEPQETEEMVPRWYKQTEIPYDQMWPDDIYWMPMFFDKRKFKGNFVFKDHSTILREVLYESSELE